MLSNANATAALLRNDRESRRNRLTSFIRSQWSWYFAFVVETGIVLFLLLPRVKRLLCIIEAENIAYSYRLLSLVNCNIQDIASRRDVGYNSQLY